MAFGKNDEQQISERSVKKQIRIYANVRKQNVFYLF